MLSSPEPDGLDASGRPPASLEIAAAWHAGPADPETTSCSPRRALPGAEAPAPKAATFSPLPGVGTPEAPWPAGAAPPPGSDLPAGPERHANNYG